MNNPDNCIRNFINGNLALAKEQAKRVRSLVIYQALTVRFGKSPDEALIIAKYLKGQATFQQACDSAIASKMDLVSKL